MESAEVLPVLSCLVFAASVSLDPSLPAYWATAWAGYTVRIQLCLDYLHRSQLSRVQYTAAQ